MKILSGVLIALFLHLTAYPQELHYVFKDATHKEIRMGADRTEIYIPLLKNKRVALCANHTTTLGNQHLVDSLLALNVNVVKLFSPEHGFRGDAEAGKKVNHSIDKKSDLPIISLYGDHKNPDSNDLRDIDIVFSTYKM
jgi:uncharacterized protein YbbC (DUF1343 family)